MTKLVRSHRTVSTEGKVAYQLYVTDDTEAAFTIPAPTDKFPETNIIDARYKLTGNLTDKDIQRVTKTLHWLSGRAPLLTEKVLQCMESEIPAAHHKSLGSILRTIAPPIPDFSDAKQFAYFNLLVDTAPILFDLASNGWRGSGFFDRNVAASLFREIEVTLTGLPDNKLHKEVALIVWLTQDTHDMSNVYPAKDHVDDLNFIASKFKEVYNARHELRELGATTRETITAHLDNKQNTITNAA